MLHIATRMISLVCNTHDEQSRSLVSVVAYSTSIEKAAHQISDGQAETVPCDDQFTGSSSRTLSASVPPPWSTVLSVGYSAFPLDDAHYF